MVSFLHTADLHLGLRLTRFDAKTALAVREARFVALDAIAKVARQQPVDFVLIAGDLFDDHAVDQEVARSAFLVLQSFPVPVYVLPGNHDPLLSGSVWDRPPWHEGNGRVRLLRKAEAITVAPGVVLFPCPVMRKTSLTDPTAWISPDGEPGIRIGVAHGSLRIRTDLPADDHLIAPTAARDHRLDYLALGHWHARRLFEDADGIHRTAYPGVHEPMRFQGSDDLRTGWVPYSTGGVRAEFLDSGQGEILRVHISGPGAPPRIEPIAVSHLTWREEQRRLNSEQELSDLIGEIANRPDSRQQLLRLKLSGVLAASAMLRLGELRRVVEGRHLLGEIDDTSLHIEPTEDEVHQVAGQGILRRVVEKLREEARSEDPAKLRVAERANLLLYQIAREVQA